MIYKSLSRTRGSNPSQLIHYVTRYSLKEKYSSKDKEEATIILRHNIKSRKIENIAKEFKLAESFRIYHRHDSVTLFHDIMSFSPRDKKFVTNKVLKDIASKYVSLRSKDSLCLVVAHRDKTSHTHMHLVVSGVKLDGYSSRVSKSSFKSIINELELYQQEKYPELIYSKNTHAKKITRSKSEIIEQIQKTRQIDKTLLINSIEDIYKKSISSKDFNSRLSKSMQLYHRNGRVQGVLLNDRKYRLSRLFDENRLMFLDNKLTQENKLLREIKAIRNGHTRKQERDILKKDVDIINNQYTGEKKFADDLFETQEQGTDRQFEETVFERTFRENEMEEESETEGTSEIQEDEEENED